MINYEAKLEPYFVSHCLNWAGVCSETEGYGKCYHISGAFKHVTLWQCQSPARGGRSQPHPVSVFRGSCHVFTSHLKDNHTQIVNVHVCQNNYSAVNGIVTD